MTDKKTIEDFAVEYAPMDPNDGHTSALEQVAFVAGAAKQKELCDEREKLLMAVIDELKDAFIECSEFSLSIKDDLEHFKISQCNPTQFEIDNCDTHHKFILKIMASIEQKLKDLK